MLVRNWASRTVGRLRRAIGRKRGLHKIDAGRQTDVRQQILTEGVAGKVPTHALSIIDHADDLIGPNASDNHRIGTRACVATPQPSVCVSPKGGAARSLRCGC